MVKLPLAKEERRKVESKSPAGASFKSLKGRQCRGERGLVSSSMVNNFILYVFLVPKNGRRGYTEMYK